MFFEGRVDYRGRTLCIGRRRQRGRRDRLEELRVTEAANIVLTAGNESATDIPDECFGPLSIILANDAAPGFGQPMLTGTDREVKLIRPLRATTYGNYQGFTQDVNFF